MNAVERREARRRRILENSEIRLKKITTLTSNETVSNGQAEFVKDKPDNNLSFVENNTLNSELPNWSAPKHHVENVTSTILEDQRVFNLDPNHLNPNTHSKNIKYYKIQFSSITILHIVLSQIVIVLFYYDLGFLFGNSIIVPFLLSAIPEFYASNEHDSIHMVVLLMLGFPRDLAKQISRSIKWASITGKRFCIYVFCFTCSYAILTNLYFDIRHISSIT